MQELLIAISLFVSILFHFKLNINKIGTHSADLLNQNPTKKIMLLYKKLF